MNERVLSAVASPSTPSSRSGLGPPAIRESACGVGSSRGFMPPAPLPALALPRRSREPQRVGPAGHPLPVDLGRHRDLPGTTRLIALRGQRELLLRLLIPGARGAPPRCPRSPSALPSRARSSSPRRPRPPRAGPRSASSGHRTGSAGRSRTPACRRSATGSPSPPCCRDRRGSACPSACWSPWTARPTPPGRATRAPRAASARAWPERGRARHRRGRRAAHDGPVRVPLVAGQRRDRDRLHLGWRADVEGAEPGHDHQEQDVQPERQQDRERDPYTRSVRDPPSSQAGTEERHSPGC